MKQEPGQGDSGVSDTGVADTGLSDTKVSYDQLRTEIEGWQQTAGFRLMDFLTLSGALPQFLSWVTRNRMVSLAQVSAITGQNEDAVLDLMNQLVAKGFLRQVQAAEGDASYRVRYVSKQSQQDERPATQDLWQAVDKEVTRLSPPILGDDNAPSSGNL
jgi:hypothetical protein